MRARPRQLREAAAHEPAAWLHGPVIDWTFGAGLGYLASVPLLLSLELVRAEGMAWPTICAAAFALFVSGPHYGATLLRVYDQREDRHRYRLFALWITISLAVLFVVGLHRVWLGSILVTLYAIWSPWHFSGQNYGVALTFLRRREVAVDPTAKKLLYTSFVLSCALAVLVIQSAASELTFSTVAVADSSAYRVLSLGIGPTWLWGFTAIVGLGYAVTTVATLALFTRRAGLRACAPAFGVLATQALWFVVPGLLVQMGVHHASGLAFATVWISAAHAAQYLWITSYYARRQHEQRAGAAAGRFSQRRFFVRCLLAGAAVTTFPALIFAPELLGRTTWDGGLALLLFSVVNLHHFILDGAVWKLRDGRVARFLLRDDESTAAPAAAAIEGPSAAHPGPFTGSPFGRLVRPRALVATLGVVSLAVAILDVWQRDYVINRAEGDLSRIERGLDALAWIGRDNPQVRAQLGVALVEAKQPDAAVAQFRRSIELEPTADRWVGLGVALSEQGRWEEASAAFETALSLEPDNLKGLAYSGRAWLEAGRPDRARERWERAAQLAPGNPHIKRELRQLALSEELGS